MPPTHSCIKTFHIKWPAGLCEAAANIPLYPPQRRDQPESNTQVKQTIYQGMKKSQKQPFNWSQNRVLLVVFWNGLISFLKTLKELQRSK